MIRALVAVVLMHLVGCTKTAYIEKPVEHRIEVARPCVTAADIPPPPRYALARLQQGVSDGQIIFAMREEIAERTDYQEVLTELLRGCSR